MSYELLFASLLLFILMISSFMEKNINDHVVHLKSVLDVLRKEKLFANLNKCTFYTNKLVFLGFVVSAWGIQLDEKKGRAIQE